MCKGEGRCDMSEQIPDAVRVCMCNSVLLVKNWLSQSKHRVEVVSRQSWRKFWLCLKGTMLMFHSYDDNHPLVDDSTLKHSLGWSTDNSKHIF